jgi:quinol-cytochrome oxidoreductase complex cytochrome b subunit
VSLTGHGFLEWAGWGAYAPRIEHEDGPPVPDRWRTWIRALLGAAALLLAVLAASGAWLWWDYRPDRDQWIGTVHQIAAFALLVAALALLVLAIIRRGRVHAPGIVAALGVFVTVGAAYVIGRLLPWDSLLLHAVVAGDDVSGVRAALGPAVGVVGVDGRAVSPSTYEAWAYAHLVLSALVVVALILVWFRTRDRRPREPAVNEPVGL